MSEKGLTPSQIESFFNSVDSEDDLDFSADDESDYYPNKEDFETSDDEVLENQVELPTDLNVPSKDVNDVATSSKKDLRRNLLWRQRSLILNENQLQLLTSTALPPELMELSQPIQFFSYLFPKKVFENISNETNLYIHQKEPNANITFTPLDIQQFVGIVLYMSISRLPKCALYWSASIGIPTIQNIMSQKTFETIRRHIHFNNNDNNLPLTDSRHDRLFKIRPLIQEINNNFGKVPKEQFLCVDEQICSTKARSHMKRYNPNKPHKWGYKIYVLSCNSGFCYKFEIDSGNENVVLLNEPDLGAASNCVVRLAREVPRHQNFRLYFDNYFNSLPLLKYLAESGILALGTIRKNRIPNFKSMENIHLRKNPRGTSVEYVADFGGVDISCPSWVDNKIVSLASNYAGIVPTDTARRFNKAKKEYIQIDRPFAVAQYNSYMGGVDLIDSIIGRYKILLRSKRWQVRIFYHLLDLTISNAWLLYKRVMKANGYPGKVLSSSDFRLDIAEVLTKVNTKSKLGKRSSVIENELQLKKQRGPTQHVPNQMVRQDQVGHWPIWADKRIRCKFPNCAGYSQVMCNKLNSNLSAL
ncbi:piggyBac transposable element-derived protein 2-like isoform X1 [Drosophila ananassae]|uniref:piggyBac transposable element-derived protein 2-like isoform X1 n=1 Tax=Drosophila ananassae TaxID=7217 RepID=UPI001CFF692D|nr:piggyBac transposable element-derived protein 2-like isoform X1 [Drosophila ananassae]